VTSLNELQYQVLTDKITWLQHLVDSYIKDFDSRLIAMEIHTGMLVPLPPLNECEEKRVNEAYEKLKPHREENPSRQYLEKCLSDKNRRITELEKECLRLNHINTDVIKANLDLSRRCDQLANVQRSSATDKWDQHKTCTNKSFEL
jgi:predicted RNase H-like nuclease (RuvC/YqgF family)